MKRTLLLFPITLLALGVGIGIFGGVFALLDYAGMQLTGGLGAIVVIFGTPIMIAMFVVRWVTRHTFRRRFFSHKPTRIPAARAVSR